MGDTRYVKGQVRPLHICVEGTKGAGKTTTIAAVRAALEAEGWAVELSAIFQDCNAWAVTQGFPGGVPMIEANAASNRAMVAWLRARLHAVRDGFFAQHQWRQRPAVLISDRGWITFHAYLYDGKWAEERSALPEINAIWDEVLREAPPTFFVHTRPEVTLRRRAGQLDAVSGLQTDARLFRDYERRLKLARLHAAQISGMWETAEGLFVDLAPKVLSALRAMSKGE
jgi:thymidylate kinase